MSTVAVVASGFTCSSASALDRPRYAVALYVASMTAAAVRVAFAESIDATSAQFGVLAARDGGGGLFTVCSGSGPALTWPVPASLPVARIVTSVPMTSPASFVVLPVPAF